MRNEPFSKRIPHVSINKCGKRIEALTAGQNRLIEVAGLCPEKSTI